MPISTEELEQRFGPLRPVETPRREYGWGDRLGASVDRFQGQVQGAMEELGLDTGDARRANEAAARYARQRAIEDTGAPETFGETFESPTKFVKGVGGLFVDSAPELGLSLGTGFAGGLTGLSTLGRLGLAAAASYPAAVGDILGSQRDESGRTDAGSAFALGVPYTVVDMLGLEGTLASGKLLRTGFKHLDEMRGPTGLASRTGANMALNAPIEGAGETFQDGLNQLGRMSVNPEETLFNEEANARYLESFLGGALMGGAGAAALGGWRRTPGFVLEDHKPTSLLGDAPPPPPAEPPPPQLGYDGRAGEYINFADGSSELRPVLEAQGDFPRRPPDPAVLAAQEAERARAEQTQAIRAKVEEVKQQALAQKQAEEQLVAERTARASELGVPLKGKLQVELFGQLEAALEQGSIDQDQFVSGLGLIAANQQGQVKKLLEAAPVMQQLVELRSTGKLNDAMFNEAEQQVKDGQLGSVRKLIAGANEFFGAAQGESNASTPAPANASPAPAPARAVAAAPNQQPGGAPPVAAVAPAQPGAPAELSSATAAPAAPSVPKAKEASAQKSTSYDELAATFSRVQSTRPGKRPAATAPDRPAWDARMKTWREGIPDRATIEAWLLEVLTDNRIEPKVREVLRRATGYDVVESGGQRRLIQPGSPMPLVQVAEDAGYSRQNASKQISQKTGLYQEVIDRLVASDVETVSKDELGVDESGDLDSGRTGTLTQVTNDPLLSSEIDAETKKRVKAALKELSTKINEAQQAEGATEKTIAEATQREVARLANRFGGVGKRVFLERAGEILSGVVKKQRTRVTAPTEDAARARINADVLSQDTSEPTVEEQAIARALREEGDLGAIEYLEDAEADWVESIVDGDPSWQELTPLEKADHLLAYYHSQVTGKLKAQGAMRAFEGVVDAAKNRLERERAPRTNQEPAAADGVGGADLRGVPQPVQGRSEEAAGGASGAQQTELTPADQTQLKKLKTKLKRYEDLVACLKAG